MSRSTSGAQGGLQWYLGQSTLVEHAFVQLCGERCPPMQVNGAIQSASVAQGALSPALEKCVGVDELCLEYLAHAFEIGAIFANHEDPMAGIVRSLGMRGHDHQVILPL